MSRSSCFLFSWETCSNRKWTAKFSLKKRFFFCSFTFAKLIDLRVCWQLIALYRAKILYGILVWFVLDGSSNILGYLIPSPFSCI